MCGGHACSIVMVACYMVVVTVMVAVVVVVVVIILCVATWRCRCGGLGLWSGRGASHERRHLASVARTESVSRGLSWQHAY